MDWYSLSIWGHRAGAYEVERTIYPPLSFVLMRIFSIAKCYNYARSEEVRDCDWVGIALLSVLMLVNTVLTFRAFHKLQGRDGWPRAFALGCGLPMFYAYERGNLVLLTYTCMMLAFGPLVRSARLRWFAAGVAVNLKVYLISAICAPMLRRRWLATEGMVLASIAIYLVTWTVLGEGSPAQIVRNITDYASSFGSKSALDLWYPATYIPLTTLIKSEFPIYNVMDSDTAAMISLLVPALMHAVQALILTAAAATWLRPEVVPPHRAVFLALALALSASEAGGYTEILVLMFVFMESWRGYARPAAIIIAFILCIPYEFVLSWLPAVVLNSFLGQRYVMAQYGIGLMSFLRPGLVLTISALLSSVTILDVWRDVKTQGWRDRWRYRHDWPLLPGVARPRRLAAHSADRVIGG